MSQEVSIRLGYDFPPEDRVMLVTGGANGIGGGCSEVFTGADFSVAILDKDKQGAEDKAHELSGIGHGKVIAVHCDVADEEQLKEAIGKSVDHFHGKLHTVIANAGVHPPDRDICDVELDEVMELMRMNLGHTWNAFRFGVGHMRKSGIGDGCLIAMSSMAGVMGQKNAVDYSASKAAQLGLVRSLAQSTAPQIRVNGVAPANVDTPLMEDWIQSTSDPEATRQAVDKNAQPIGRMADPEEIGRICLELALGRFRTGEIIMPDGGAATYQR